MGEAHRGQAWKAGSHNRHTYWSNQLGPFSSYCFHRFDFVQRNSGVAPWGHNAPTACRHTSGRLCHPPTLFSAILLCLLDVLHFVCGIWLFVLRQSFVTRRPHLTLLSGLGETTETILFACSLARFRRDVHRTLPQEELFRERQGKGQLALFRRQREPARKNAL